MQIQTWLETTEKQLSEASIESARLDTLLLLENATSKSREWILAHGEDELTPEDIHTLNNQVLQRKKRIPLAYILGSKEFYSRHFIVNPDVLIPRPESEAIITFLKKIAASHEINTVIDIGTGSGCLAITAALELPDVHITACDTSKEALAVARKNAREYGVRIRFHQSDLFTNLPGMPKTRPYVVIANLPYVPDTLITSEEIKKEPAQALFSGEDGLHHYRRFWQELTARDNLPFAVIVESLEDQHPIMTELARKAGYSLQQTDTLIQLFTLKN